MCALCGRANLERGYGVVKCDRFRFGEEVAVIFPRRFVAQSNSVAKNVGSDGFIQFSKVFTNCNSSINFKCFKLADRWRRGLKNLKFTPADFKQNKRVI
jgi:hypothetical protein